MKLSTEQINELNHFIKEEGDCPEWLEMWAMNHYADEIPYGTITGDTGTMDEWIVDRIDRVTDFFGEYL